jgi:myosin heavy subunit
LFFDSHGAISSAAIENYLLEKSRVKTQSPNERGYHIFHMLLNSVTEGENYVKFGLDRLDSSVPLNYLADLDPTDEKHDYFLENDKKNYKELVQS